MNNNDETNDSLVAKHIEDCIYMIREQKVMLDEDLAKLYQVETKVLVQALKRNIDRFPEDFMFQLTTEEYSILRSQFVTSTGKTGRRYPPYAFTEQGVAMLSSVLRSKLAVKVNIQIVRTFVKIRALTGTHEILAQKLLELELRYDSQFQIVFDAIRQIMDPKKPDRKRQIGFREK